MRDEEGRLDKLHLKLEIHEHRLPQLRLQFIYLFAFLKQ